MYTLDQISGNSYLILDSLIRSSHAEYESSSAFKENDNPKSKFKPAPLLIC